MTNAVPRTMTPDDVEEIYTALARSIDRAGPQNEALFLAKLALLLGHQMADPARFAAALETALLDLPPTPARLHANED